MGSTKNQNWFDDAENLYTAALHKIIVENRFQPQINETNITRLGAARLGVHKIYNWSFKITKGTKLVMFHFKINRWIIYTKVKLKEANLISDDMCHLCKTEKHATKHIFLQCFHVVSFLNDLRAWWHFNTKENTHLNVWTCQAPKAPGSFKFGLATSKILYLQNQFSCLICSSNFNLRENAHKNRAKSENCGHTGIRAIFCQGGGEPFAQKFAKGVQIFTRQSKGNKGHIGLHTK